MGDPSKEKVLKEFTIILEEFLNQCERASVKSQHQNDSSVRKHNLAHEPHSKSKSASLMSETSKLEQMSSDSPSALCSDTERKHQKKSFFRRTRDRLLSTFRRQSTARKATSKQSSIESNKKSATKRLVQDKTFDQKDGYDRKLFAGQEIRKETSLNPATNEELNLHQIMSKSTRNPELGAGEQTETLHDRCNRRPAHFSSGERNEKCINYHQIPQGLNGADFSTQQGDQALALSSAQTRVHVTMKTVLDEPSEDIRFIDEDDDDDDKKVGQTNNYGDQSSVQHRIAPKLRLPSGGSRPLAITANVKQSGENTGPQSLPQEERGLALKAGSGTASSSHHNDRFLHQLQKQFSLEIDGDDMHDGEEATAEGEATPLLNSTEKIKDEEVSKIAEKIINMADEYVESTRAAQKEDFLEDLERQIAEWVRTTGDNYATMMDRQGQTFIQQLTDKTYEDFKRIICNSLGEEVTSNHLVILFYTVKGTLSLVGRSSAFVTRLIQFASRYYMDEIHGWLTQRGGFQSLLDQTESLVDSED